RITFIALDRQEVVGIRHIKDVFGAQVRQFMVETGASQVDRLDIPEDIAAVDLTKVDVFAQAQPDGVFAGTAVEQAAAVQQCVVPVCGGMVKDAQVELTLPYFGRVSAYRLNSPCFNGDLALGRTGCLDKTQFVGVGLAQPRPRVGVGTAVIRDIVASQQAVQAAPYVERGMCAQA